MVMIRCRQWCAQYFTNSSLKRNGRMKEWKGGRKEGRRKQIPIYSIYWLSWYRYTIMANLKLSTSYHWIRDSKRRNVHDWLFGWQELVLAHHWVGGQKQKDWSNFSVKRGQCSKSIPHSVQRMPQLGVHHLSLPPPHTHTWDLENRMGSEM